MKAFNCSNVSKTNSLDVMFFRVLPKHSFSLKKLVLSFLIFFAIFNCSVRFAIGQSDAQTSNLQVQPTEQTLAQVERWVSESEKTLCFKENKGQMQNVDLSVADYVLFKVEQPGLNVWVTTTGLTYQFFTIEKKLITNADGTPKVGMDGKQEKVKTVCWHRVDMVLKNASISKDNIHKENIVSQGDERYYLAHCPDGIVGVQSYGKVTIANVYEGIDWVLYTDNQTGTLKFDFVVHPGADPNQLQLIYEGSGTLDVLPKQLLVKTPLGSLSEGELLCYQGHESNSIEASYQAKKLDQPTYLGAGNVQNNSQESALNTKEWAGFSYQLTINLADYNAAETLIIDPELVWGTLYGGSAQDGLNSVDTDNSGNVFATGYITGANFPVQNAGTFYQATNAGTDDVCILKCSNVGVRLWATYYGGTSFEEAYAIALDGSNNVWITGITWSTNFPVQAGAGYNQAVAPGNGDAFILKFNNAGTRLWATYYGGASGSEQGYGIAIDGANNVWITGYTGSNNFPVLAGAGFNQAASGGWWDVFILKFTNAGTRLWSTYYGGAGYEQGFSITTDAANNVLVTGKTNSANFPILAGGGFNQAANAGSDDAFILKFTNAGTRSWATYYGGTGNDQGYSIAADASSNIWVTGYTNSTDFPVQNSGTFFQGANAGSNDVFILKFANTTARSWATYYGGTGDDKMGDEYDHIVIDNFNNVCVVFETASNNVPTFRTNVCEYMAAFGGGTKDAFLLRFNNTGTRMWATYIGGNNSDFRGALALDGANNNLLVVGEFINYASSATLPMLDLGGGAYYDNSPGGGDDSYILKFNDCVPLPIELVLFEAIPENHNRVRLNWITATETNNDFFTLERSADGIGFEQFKTRQGAGNSNTSINYSDYDDQPYLGISYYRLKQTDFNGDYSYSDIRVVHLSELDLINLFPNPVKEQLTFSISSSNDDELIISILDVFGRTIFTDQYEVQKGITTIKINTSQLAVGTYWVKATTKNGLFVNKELVKTAE